MSNRPRTGCSDEQPETAQSAETRKRKRGWDVLDQRRDHQLATAQKCQNVKRSIYFEEVFQDGNAPIKHVIVQWPPGQGSWYILRCEEHDFNFKDNPLVGAAAHIRSKKHDKKSSDYNTVMELLGIEVLGCGERLAEKNNVAARQAFKNGYGHPTAESIQVRRWTLLRTEDVHVIIDGNTERLRQSLIRNMGKYISKTFSWKEGYEDNGPRVSMREFPVMFFDGSPFPSKSSVAWVSASDLQIYDASAQNLIEHNQQVLNYLEARESAGGQKIASEARRRESFPADPDKEQAQGSGCPSTSTSWDEEAPENSQPDTNATPIIASLVETVPIGEKSFFQHAPQTDGDTSTLQGRPDQSPNDQSRGVAACLASSYDEEAGASMADLERQVSQSTQETSPSEQEAARVAQMAWDVINQTHSGTEGAPTNQVHGSQDVSLVRRQQEPAISQNVSRIHTEQTSTETARKTSQPEDVFQINASPSPQSVNSAYPVTMVVPQQSFRMDQQPTSYGPLPPIRPLEEHIPLAGQGYYWPNGASVSSIESSRHCIGTTANAQQHQSRTGGLQTSTMTFGSNLPVPQAPVNANDAWVSNFPPPLVDELKRVTRSTSRDPRPKDFINPQGDFRCPFCSKESARLGVFTKHLKERCVAVQSVARTATLSTLRPKSHGT
ncbi:hypothetical protein ACJZ2D_015637 [Fusarium nematophilum]